MSGPQADPRRYGIIRSDIDSAGDRPIILFGDSIVQDAALPRTVCGRVLVNAGVGGATINYFSDRALTLLGSTQPSLILLAIGVNNAWRTTEHDTAEAFDRSYRSLVQRLSARAPVIVATLTGIKNGAFAVNYDERYLAPLNRTIMTAPGAIARIDFDTLFSAGNATSDGIHLNDRGYAIWTAAVIGAIEHALSCR